MNYAIANVTLHPATDEQVAAGVEDIPHDLLDVQALLTFDGPPSREEMAVRAKRAAYALRDAGYRVAMIGGAPFFMPALERGMTARGVRVVYAFSARESVEHVQPDGSVKKSSVFRHAGFVDGADQNPWVPHRNTPRLT